MIYGDPGTVFPLSLTGGTSGDRFTLSIPPGLSLMQRILTRAPRPIRLNWTFIGPSGIAITHAAGRSELPVLASYANTGAKTAFADGVVTLNRDTYLSSEPLGIDFGATNDARTTQTPRRLRFSFRGTAPLSPVATIFLELFVWNVGRFSFTSHWESGKIAVDILRDDQAESFISTSGRTNGAEQLLEVEWQDDRAGQGGTITFFIDGRNAGGPFRTKVKPRLPGDASLSVNASLGNTHNSVDGLRIRELAIAFDLEAVEDRYRPVASGPIDRATLEALMVDARSVVIPEPARTISWADAAGTINTVDVIIGPLDVPPGQAYKAVLVDYSSGQPVPHPNVLVMTRIAAQNCRFGDPGLDAGQPPWIECLPQGPVPNIAGINYYCEAIRCGDYVQFQFGYDWDIRQMPANPFGDPIGKHSYMVPHRWLIYDVTDKRLATIEAADGKPLNSADRPPIFPGPFDGRNCAITTPQNQWHPHGTVRSGIIWRSADPAAHDNATYSRSVPLFDLSVPFGSHTSFSVNGFDMRLFSGGSGNDGQANGFANCRVMSWDPTTYAQMMDRAGATRDPYKASLYSPNSMAANAGLWLRYTPFNMQGRSPLTGPGGVRDDRQIMPEPVAQYAGAPDKGRPHDGRSYRDICLAYLTGYVSDAIHCFERDRNVPLFKGDPHRPITMRNHYYGPGVAGTAPSMAYYVQSGRIYDWVRGVNPLRVASPYAGDTPETPYFGTCQIDKSHGHQFPGWGSLLFRTPEFAFLGHKFWDQNRLYANVIIGDEYAELWGTREGAWAYMHAALAWKTASPNSTRLYDLEEVMAFVVADFEHFHDRHYAATPGFANPPANISVNGGYEGVRASYAAAAIFGTLTQGSTAITQQDFQIGYWLTALAAAEKVGFNAALRARSKKAGIVLDWLIAMQRKRIVGRLLHAPNVLPDGGNTYTVLIWTAAQVRAAGGDVAKLPNSYESLAAANGSSARWDYYKVGDQDVTRDGAAMDLLIAGPSILRYLLNQSGADIEAAQAVANQWRNEKKTSQLKKGEDAGTDWFRYLVACHNPAKPVQTL